MIAGLCLSIITYSSGFNMKLEPRAGTSCSLVSGVRCTKRYARTCCVDGEGREAFVECDLISGVLLQGPSQPCGDGYRCHYGTCLPIPAVTIC